MVWTLNADKDKIMNLLIVIDGQVVLYCYLKWYQMAEKIRILKSIFDLCVEIIREFQFDILRERAERNLKQQH
jgi:hypothetical protein